MASEQQSPRPRQLISSEEKNTFKLMKMIYHIANSVIFKIYTWGTKVRSEQTVEDYLRNTRGYSNRKYGKYFDNYQIELMSKKSSECNFDICLLAKVIKHTCHKVDSMDDTYLEKLLHEIKDFRHRVSHRFKGITKDDLLKISTELMDLLTSILLEAGNLFGKHDEAAAEVQSMEESINIVRVQSLADSDILQYEIIQMNEKIENIIKEEGRKELEQRYAHLCQINPIDFLENNKVLVDVNMVFTQIEVINIGQKAKGLQVPCKELLTFCRSFSMSKNDAKILSPEVYLLEGPAGAGKTTLMKYIKASWSRRENNDDRMFGLDEFDLVLFMECRKSSLESFSQLLSALMKDTNSSKYLREGDLLRYARSLKTLILVDGLDELNSSSEKLFSDIINQENNNFVVLCTSRPEKTRYFMKRLPPTFRTAHLKIIGIADDKKEDFIRKYHGALQRKGWSQQHTENLVNFIRKSESSLQSHYRLPLNLVLLTWLWADDPDSVSMMTTSSELYIKTHNLMKKKLISRIINKEGAHIDEGELGEKLKRVLCCVYEQSLYSLSIDAIDYLSPQSLRQIKSSCEANKLPYRETLSAFFVIRTVEEEESSVAQQLLCDVEEEEKVSVPHKMLYDFYAAQCVVQNLFNKGQEDKEEQQRKVNELLSHITDPALRESLASAALATIQLSSTSSKPGSLKTLISEKCLKTCKKMNKYRTMLLQVAGIIYALHEHEVEPWIAQEIVEVLRNSELGVKDDNEWYDLLDLTKNNRDIISFVSEHINTALTVTEERVDTAVQILLKPRPVRILLDIASKASSVSPLETLMHRIADCGSEVDLVFRQDFSKPGSTPSNDRELGIISQRCELGQLVGHVSGSVLAGSRGSFTCMSLALTSNEAAQDMMLTLKSMMLPGLCLHITLNVSPKFLSKITGVAMLCLVVSKVQDENVAIVSELAKTLLPQESMLMDMRFPEACVTYSGWVRLLKDMKAAAISAGHISLPQNVVLSDEEMQWLNDFTFYKMKVRGSVRKLSEKAMWESPFSAT